MLTKEDIEHLATLARLEITDEEKDQFAAKLGPVLSYVSDISAVATGEIKPEAGELRNVMREDNNANEGGKYTDAILENAPNTEDGYVKVEQIL